MRIRSLAAILVAAWTMLSSSVARAHPLGNFSISHYSGIRVGKDNVEIKYVIDMAEIPTFQEIQEHGIAADAEAANAQAYVARKAEILRDGLSLRVNGKPLRLQVDSQQIIFPPGAGGLPTLKIGVLLKAQVDAANREQWLEYRDENFPGRAGWKEIIATASNVELTSSSVPGADRSRQLSDYPTDLLNSPPQQLTAQIGFVAQSAPPAVASVKNSVAIAKPLAPPPTEPARAPRTDSRSGDSSGGPAGQLAVNKQATPRNSFTEMMATKQLSLNVILLGLVVAVGLGAFHALEPGHGKTLVAAYLVGSRGTLKHALALGLIVTGSHTAGVYLLGAVTLYASQYIVPERLYPWLALISGLMVVGLGSVLLLRRYLGKDKLVSHPHGPAYHSHDHPHHHEHDHAHGHQHGNHAHHRHEVNQAVSLKQLVTLGISGGIVPCPAALVVLLSAVSVQRIGVGLLLIVAFSVGLAAVLIAVGMLMVCARQFMSRFHGEGRLVTRWLPLTSAVFIVLFGVGLTWQALLSTGFIQL